MATSNQAVRPVNIVIGFAVGSILAAVFGAGFWLSTLAGILGAVIAHFGSSNA